MPDDLFVYCAMNNITDRIIFEDKHLLLVNKAAGLMVEEDQYGNPNLIQLLRKHIQGKSRNKVFIQNVHRLDRPVSGIVLFAKKPSDLKNLSEQFRNRTPEKIYLAVTESAPEKKEARLSHYHYKNLKEKKAEISSEKKKETDVVELEYKIIGEAGKKFLWQIKLITGKYHQIRAQLAFAGCPVIGDEKYGSAAKYGQDAIALHAWKLGFIHSATGEKAEYAAPLPADDLWKNFKVNS
ncbi:MAG: RluA family pseudouridine synthase [Cytophagaceae bacterium]|nr:RluA family pseudouridine synthase [Cytophagaceae bacterium]